MKRANGWPRLAARQFKRSDKALLAPSLGGKVNAIANRFYVTRPGADRYGHMIGTILVDGSMLDAEAADRSGRLGLWVDANPVPPWEWRAQKRQTN